MNCLRWVGICQEDIYTFLFGGIDIYPLGSRKKITQSKVIIEAYALKSAQYEMMNEGVNGRMQSIFEYQ